MVATSHDGARGTPAVTGAVSPFRTASRPRAGLPARGAAPPRAALASRPAVPFAPARFAVPFPAAPGRPWA